MSIVGELGINMTAEGMAALSKLDDLLDIMLTKRRPMANIRLQRLLTGITMEPFTKTVL